MKRFSPVITLALLLSITFSAQPVLLAQVANPTNGSYQGPGKYEKQIRLFEEFAQKQMGSRQNRGHDDWLYEG